MTILSYLLAWMVGEDTAITRHNLGFIVLVYFKSTVVEGAKAREPLLYEIIVIFCHTPNALTLKSTDATGFRAIYLSRPSISIEHFTGRLSSIFSRSWRWVSLI